MNKSFNYKSFFENTGIYEELFLKTDNIWEVFLHFDEFLERFSSSELSQGYTQISSKLFIGENVTIHETARIEGSAIIGHNSIIGHAALLRGGVLTGEGVNILHAAEVKHSLLLSDTHVSHLNYIGDSILGSRVNISGGAILANMRLDRNEVTVMIDDNKIGVGYQKFGSVIGDDGFIGANAVLNPGTVLFKKSAVYPLVSVVGTHPEGSKVK